MSAISYHFGSKDELYRACLREEGMSLLHLMERILTPPTSKEDFKLKLSLFLNEYFANTVRKRDLILIVSKDVNSKNAMGSINDIFQKIPLITNEFFLAAQKNGIISESLETTLLGDLFLNPLFMQVLFADRFVHKNDVTSPEFQKKYVSQQIDVILNGLLLAP